MKRPVVLVLVLALAVAAMATVAAAQEVPPNAMVRAEGKMYQSAVADTIHSTLTKASSVAASKWRGPLTVYSPKDNGDFQTRKSLPNAFVLAARKPFRFKAIYANGDSSGTVHTLVDTLATARAGTLVAWSDIFACRTVIHSPCTQVRTVPASGDTVYVLPYVEVVPTQ